MLYEILSAPSEQALKLLIARHLYEGWQVIGGLSVVVHKDSFKFYQAIIKTY